MKEITAIFGSNLVNRYGMIMPVPVLESALNQAWDRPLPSSIGHDIHRATGYTFPVALHIQPALARLFGVGYIAETSEEVKEVERILNLSILRSENELDQNLVQTLRAKLGLALSAKARLHSQGCISFLDNGLALRICPEIFSSQDKDGLVPLAGLRCVGPGIFEKDGLLFFAHRFFRRSLSHYNTLNDPFLDRLVGVSKDRELDVRIALDEDLVGLPGTLLKNIELQYWWGPHFSGDLKAIPTGVTRHKASESDKFFNAIAATDFWWYVQDERKTFECEEIRDLNTPSMGESKAHFGCRFVHSMLDKDASPIHLDGAIRLYDEDLFLERVDKDIMHFGRLAQYTKLWRIDGPLSVETWKQLINDYYRDNHLVGEYFGGKEEGETNVRPKEIKIDKAGSILEFVPCTMARGDGIRIAISYHPHGKKSATRIITPTEQFSTDEIKSDFVEACTVEIVKLLKRMGESIEFSDETAVVAFEDMVSNLPLIEHCDSEFLRHARVTLRVIHDYCTSLKVRGDDRMFGFHLSLRYPDREVIFSFAGHVDDVCAWLQADQAQFPETVGAIGKWAEAACRWLTDTFPNARIVPPMENMIKTTGMLIADRKFLERDEFVFRKSDDGSTKIVLTKCPRNERALPLVQEKGLVAVPSWLIKASKCKKCHASYKDCDCIKLIDEGVVQIVTDGEILGYFWTDRPA